MKRLEAVVFIGMSIACSFGEVNFSGDIQYRFRYEWNALHAIPDSTRGDYTNRYAWNFKGSVTKDNLFFGLRLSNPNGPGSDNITDNISTVAQGNYNLVSIPEMYFKWTVSSFSASAGIIPVEENTVLDLVIYEYAKYIDYKRNIYAGTDPWCTLMNNSQKGVSLNYNLKESGDFTLKVGLLSAMAKDTTSYIYKPGEKFNNDQVRFMLTVPMAYKGSLITAMPIFHVRTNVYQSAGGMQSNHSYAGGLDFGVKPMDLFAVKLGFAYGTYKNDAQQNDTGYAPVNPFGILSYAGFILKPGYGEIDADFDYSLAQDKLNRYVLNGVVTDRHDQLFFMDLKYGMPIKNLTVLPRLRLWHRFNDVTGNTLTTIRPEFILKAAF
jgi:hypothetical protein